MCGFLPLNSGSHRQCGSLLGVCSCKTNGRGEQRKMVAFCGAWLQEGRREVWPHPVAHLLSTPFTSRRRGRGWGRSPGVCRSKTPLWKPEGWVRSTPFHAYQHAYSPHGDLGNQYYFQNKLYFLFEWSYSQSHGILPNSIRAVVTWDSGSAR